jgi:hypothetical protein
MTSCNNIGFDSEKWKNCKFNSEDGFSLRWDMSEDLIKNYGLIGKDTTDIFNLLGTEKLDCYNGKCIARYVLGGCRSGIDMGTLELTFENGKVKEVFKHCN